MTDEQREAFERWMQSTTWEFNIERYTDVSPWRGQYRSVAVTLASEAFLAGIEYAKKEAAK